MQAVMDSVVGQESLASGGVSAEEIADALAQSIPSLPTPPAPSGVPMGRPPSALPKGRPPVSVPLGRPPALAPQGRPPAAAPPQPAAPTIIEHSRIRLESMIYSSSSTSCNLSREI